MIRSRLLTVPALALSIVVAATLATVAIAAPSSPTLDSPPAVTAGHRIVVYPAPLEADVQEAGVTIWDRGDGVVLGGATESVIQALSEKRIDPLVNVPDENQWVYLLNYINGYQTAPFVANTVTIPLTQAEVLYLFPRSVPVELPNVKPWGQFRGVPRIGLEPVKVHAADLHLIAAEGAPEREAQSLVPETANPLVTAIVNATSQALWYQDVREMSGDATVTIAGVPRTIATRWSNVMFPPNTNALASEYILEKGAAWGYTGVRDSYTSTDSGCLQNGTWQNMVFTLPGQVDYGQHQQVIFVTHYDSLSYNTTENTNFSPGADDAISGGSALFEAMRLFRNYGFKNTVKIIFFSGEEQGLCGSIAYTRQTAAHPTADMWRVVNMDQTAYDGNKNGWMDCYNWDSTNSPASVALGQSYVDANVDYGTIITPANIFRPTNKMCQTDHCPFWNVGVAAIAITEDLFHSEICPCFDQSQTSTCHDTVTQIDPLHPAQLMFDQNFSWPSQKTAIATVAHLAEPLYACPASAPTPVLTPGNNTMRVTWPVAAGVTNYVVERAATCAGPFTGMTSATGTTYDDIAVTNGTSYAYRIRTCPTQVSACVTGAPVAGPSVIYQTNTASVAGDTGDHDTAADNCELVTATLNVVNDGNTPLTGVKVIAISSSNPAVQVASQIPQTVGNLGVGASAPVTFKFYLGRSGGSAACGEAIPFTVVASSNESPNSTRNFTLTAEKDSASGSFTYGFETGFDGWTVSTGSFTRVVNGAPGSNLFSLHSRNANSICDAIASPTITPTASSTMTMYVNYSIETPNIYDRAVVRAINTLTGVKTLLVPTGAPYTTTGDSATLCDGIDQLSGWAGNLTTWTQATFNLAAFAGQPIQIEARFATDSSALGTQGFWFDLVNITNATQSSCDVQANSCAALPAEVSPTGNPVPFTVDKSGANFNLRFSEVAGATAYEVYAGTLASLHTGVYDHASTGGVCALIDGSGGDGQVTASLSSATFPSNSYLLAVAKNGAGESIYGTRTGGATIPVALTSCP